MLFYQHTNAKKFLNPTPISQFCAVEKEALRAFLFFFGEMHAFLVHKQPGKDASSLASKQVAKWQHTHLPLFPRKK